MLLPVLGSLSAIRPSVKAWADATMEKRTLLLDPLNVQGAWEWPDAAAHVLVRMRDVCLSGIRLVSDRQPDRILVDDRTSGTPAIWLHEENPKTAWIIVHVAGSSWCQLCYQFGHELGHVLCNSWDAQAKPALPCQWIEEALVEAFSIRGLGLLAASWERDPPFPGDASYARSIREYREEVLNTYSKLAAEEGATTDLAAWFQLRRSSLDSQLRATGAPRFLPSFWNSKKTTAGSSCLERSTAGPSEGACQSRSTSYVGRRVARSLAPPLNCPFG